MLARHYERPAYEILEFSTKNWKCHARDYFHAQPERRNNWLDSLSIADFQRARHPTCGYKGSRKSGRPRL